MNYFDLINKCLTELNYRQVNNFNELIKNDHRKIKNIINLINTEICNFDKWNFLLRKSTLTLNKNTGEIENNINGRIDKILVDNQNYEFFEHFEKFLMNTQPPYTYSSFNNKLLFPISNKDRNIEVIYYTKNTAKDSGNNEKLLLENSTDTPLIPKPFVEPLLVYGTCLRLKANPKHEKFSYWISMYKDALTNLRSKNCIDINNTPNLKLFRY